jgi:hypothetical protein
LEGSASPGADDYLRSSLQLVSGEMLDPSKPYPVRRPIPDLFKFMGLKGERLSWLEGILLRGEFYFSFPDELNDPFEWRPRFVLPVGDPALHEIKYRKWLKSKGHSWKQFKKRRRSLSEIAEMVTRHWRSPDGERRQVQMFCMASVRAHPLLWAHYADGHRGVCVHLDKHYVPFGAAQKVDYSDVHLSIPMFDRPDEDEVFRRLALLKGLEWEYEAEYRVVRYLRSETADLDLKWRGQRALASPAAINGITLGAEISLEDERAVLEMVRKRTTPIPVWKAVPDEERFAFNFDPVLVTAAPAVSASKA